VQSVIEARIEAILPKLRMESREFVYYIIYYQFSCHVFFFAYRQFIDHHILDSIL
jgi:hypothetical protein